MAKLILDENAKFAAKLGINPAARSTCVKPAGTTSCILGTASGIHAHHAIIQELNVLHPPSRFHPDR